MDKEHRGSTTESYLDASRGGRPKRGGKAAHARPGVVVGQRSSRQGDAQQTAAQQTPSIRARDCLFDDARRMGDASLSGRSCGNLAIDCCATAGYTTVAWAMKTSTHECRRNEASAARVPVSPP